MLFETISTGIRSKGFDLGIYMFFKIPRVAKSERPPAAEIESVHPLNGCSRELAIMDGLKMTVLTP